VQHAGAGEPDLSGEQISAEVLAMRMGRYLIQHPYIRTLSINAFNPGHATLLAQAILYLQKVEIFRRPEGMIFASLC